MIYKEDFLMHYGAKGQKWGVRRWQNYDGSLTSAGRQRYNDDVRKTGTYTYAGTHTYIGGPEASSEWSSQVKRLADNVLKSKTFDGVSMKDVSVSSFPTPDKGFFITVNTHDGGVTKYVYDKNGELQYSHREKDAEHPNRSENSINAIYGMGNYSYRAEKSLPKSTITATKSSVTNGKKSTQTALQSFGSAWITGAKSIVSSGKKAVSNFTDSWNVGIKSILKK